MNHETRTHLDLFSGIGGFALAAQWAGFRTVGFCEIDLYAQQILIKNFGAVLANAKNERHSRREDSGSERSAREQERDIRSQSCRQCKIHPNIRTLNGADYFGVDLITGGFPCQPYSLAGKRRGAADDRALWPEMRRVIAEARPRWVLAENVPGIINLELDTVLSDLENLGYSTGTIVVPACAVDAPHRRDRVWIVAHGDSRNGYGRGGAMQVGRSRKSGQDKEDGATGLEWCPEPSLGGTLDGLSPWLDTNRKLTMQSHKSILAYAKSKNVRPAEVLRVLRCKTGTQNVWEQTGGSGGISPSQVLFAYLCELEKEAGTLGNIPLEGQETSRQQVRGVRSIDEPSRTPHRQRSEKQRTVKHPDSLHSLSSLLALHAEQAWGHYRHQNAKTILTSWQTGWEDGFRRVAHGIPNRVDRLKCLGNAIVPQVAAEILKAMIQSEEAETCGA